MIVHGKFVKGKKRSWILALERRLRSGCVASFTSLEVAQWIRSLEPGVDAMTYLNMADRLCSFGAKGGLWSTTEKGCGATWRVTDSGGDRGVGLTPRKKLRFS